MVHSRAVFSSGRAIERMCLTSVATLGAFLEDGVTPRSLSESPSAGFDSRFNQIPLILVYQSHLCNETKLLTPIVSTKCLVKT